MLPQTLSVISYPPNHLSFLHVLFLTLFLVNLKQSGPISSHINPGFVVGFVEVAAVFIVLAWQDGDKTGVKNLAEIENAKSLKISKRKVVRAENRAKYTWLVHFSYVPFEV